MTNNTPREDRYRAKVDVKGPDECWPWKAGRNRLGYGTFRGDDGEQLAHRYGYKLANGPIPKGLSVCHHCDNPECQNPRHWFLGTHSDNMGDMAAKGRWRPGEIHGSRNGNAKLSESDIPTIVSRYQSGESQAAIAADYNIDQTAISKLLRGAGWTHTGIAPTSEPKRRATGSRNPRTKLTPAAVLDIRARYAAGGISQRELGEEYGVPQTAISAVVLGKTHTTIKPLSS